MQLSVRLCAAARLRFRVKAIAPRASAPLLVVSTIRVALGIRSTPLWRRVANRARLYEPTQRVPGVVPSLARRIARSRRAEEPLKPAPKVGHESLDTRIRGLLAASALDQEQRNWARRRRQATFARAARHCEQERATHGG
jgi:hypothetical protein